MSARGDSRHIRSRKISLPSAGAGVDPTSAGASASEFSGNCSLSLSLPTSTARDFEPQLALVYGTAGGNGPFGRGFGLSLGSICRSTTLRTPQYGDSDVFVFDDPLVSIGTSTLSDLGVTFRVTRFRPRRSGKYDRIELWQADGADPFWRVTTGDNITTVFGRTAQARVCDPADAQRIFEWLAEYQYDARGNAVVFEYKQENLEGLEAQPAEVHRVNTANRYLARVCYGNKVPFDPATGLTPIPDLAWSFELQFDYGEYDLSPMNPRPHDPRGPWAARLDPISNYSAGFERRTHRLCHNIALFHNFAELGSEARLTHVLQLTYCEDKYCSLLVGARNVGYRYVDGATPPYTTKSGPLLQLGYSRFDQSKTNRVELTTADGTALPDITDEATGAFLDIDGCAVPGYFYADGNTVEYWRPVLCAEHLEYSPSLPASFPIERSLSGAYRFEDLNSDGRLSLVVEEQTRHGFYRREPAATSQPPALGTFTPFATANTQIPGALWEIADMAGTGRSDRVAIRQGLVTIIPSAGESGFGQQYSVACAPDLPITPYAPDPLEQLTFASVCGSGIQRVRVRDGSVECWPMLGSGVFGAAVRMHNAPGFAPNSPPPQIRFADIDGSGLADLVFAYGDRAEIYRNQSGNSFSDSPIVVAFDGPRWSPDQLAFVDLFGDGSESLVFSTYLPVPRHVAHRFNPDGKPGLLVTVDNSLGSQSLISYCSSATASLKDAADGLFWPTALPFPIPLVTQIRNSDAISGTITSTCYRYHYGCYDPIEREFRGFGMVERFDTEQALVTATERASVGSTQAAVSAPCRTKTWFHTGVLQYSLALQSRFQTEFFGADALAAPQPPDFTQLLNPTDADATRQAYAALSGRMLRTETYGLDGPDASVPYKVTQQSALVTQVAAQQGTNPYAAFLVTDRESIDSTYEQLAADPLTTHSFVLKVGEDGNIERGAAVAYGRRSSHKNDTDAFPEQFDPTVTCSITGYLDAIDHPHTYLRGLPGQQREYQILNVNAPDLCGLYYSWAAIDAQIEAAIKQTASTQQSPPTLSASLHGGIKYQWLTDSNGEVTPQALVLGTAQLAFPDSLAQTVLAGAPLPSPVEQFLGETCGFELQSPEQLWWNPGLQQTYLGAAGFFLAASVQDVFSRNRGSRTGTTETYGYDPYFLLLRQVTKTPSVADVLPATVTADEIDYQAMRPRRLSDANGVTSEILQDPLNNVVATTSYGSELLGGRVGAVGFAPIDFKTPWPTPTSVQDVLEAPLRYVQGAGCFYFVDPTAFERDGRPVSSVCVKAADYPNTTNPAPPIIEIAYQDGFGRVAQKSTSAAPGDGITCDTSGKPVIGLDGKPVIAPLATRWLTSGRRLFTNKGEPFKSYEPFFIASTQFMPPAWLPAIGVSATSHYDCLGRSIRVGQERAAFEEAFFSRTAYGSWSRKVENENDTVLESDYYQYYMVQGHDLPPLEKQALTKAAAVAGGCTRIIWDNRGNTIATCRLLQTAGQPEELTSRAGYDIAGNQIWAADPRLQQIGVKNITRTFTLDGAEWQCASVDSGNAIALRDVAGNVVFTSNARSFATLLGYDSLQRPVSVTAMGGDGPSALNQIVHRITYGDSLDSTGATAFPLAGSNTRGQIVVAYDQAGCVLTPSFTIHGKPIVTSRQMRQEFIGEAHWNCANFATWSGLFASLATQLQTSSPYCASFTYDGLARLTSATDVDGNTQTTRYDAGGHVVAKALLAAKGTTAQQFVKNVSYTARNEIESLVRADALGNELLETTLTYDPMTGRMTSLVTNRLASGDCLQDLTYFYDPIGNLTHVRDLQAPAARVIYKNQVVTADCDYTYDSLDRLLVATGRAVTGLLQADEANGTFARFLPSTANPNDTRALENYTLTYGYDQGGNLLSTTFQAPSSSWAQQSTVDTRSNRAVEGNARPGFRTPQSAFDACGNPRSLSTLPSLSWDYLNHLQIATCVARGSLTDSDLETYQYAADSARVRKTTQRQISAGIVNRVETLYLGGIEITRTYRGDQLVEEYHRARLELGNTAVAERLHWTLGSPPAAVPSPEIRHQLSNELGSVSLEVNDLGRMISYEETAPYGATTFAAGSSLVEVSLRRFRFSNKERDQTTGLYAFGARYYAPWMGRWINPDPVGTSDGLNLYCYVANNPTRYIDNFGYGRGKPGKSSKLVRSDRTLRATPARLKRAQDRANGPTRPTKKGNPYKPAMFKIVVMYPSANMESEVGRLSGRWRSWFESQTRPPIPREVRQQLIKEAGSKNTFLLGFKQAGADADLRELGINQDHKLAQSWIAVHLATIMDTWDRFGRLSQSQTDAVKEWMSSLHGDDAKGAAEFDALHTAATTGDVDMVQIQLTSTYRSLAGKALANFKLGSAFLNQVIFNSADWHYENGSRTPRSERIFQATHQLASHGVIDPSLAVASTTTATTMGGAVIDSADDAMMIDLGDELLSSGVAIPAEQQVRAALHAQGRPGY